mgnify:CR=1 FL=1
MRHPFLNLFAPLTIWLALTIPAAAAIVAAIENALEPFHVHLTDVPMTPARIVAAIADGVARGEKD